MMRDANKEANYNYLNAKLDSKYRAAHQVTR